MLAWWWRVLVLLKRTPSPMNPTGKEEGIAKEKLRLVRKFGFRYTISSYPSAEAISTSLILPLDSGATTLYQR